MEDNTVGGILREYYADYRKKNEVSWEQEEVVERIIKCRTPAYGGRMKICNECGHIELHYNSCKDRHCPQCGHYEKEQWIMEQEKWVLPIPYYHGVFTISHELNGLMKWNDRRLYDCMMRTVGVLLKEYGEQYLGGEIGVTMVLHTWGQTLQYHVHVHCVITGGGLGEKEGDVVWKAGKKKYLFPVKKLSRDFRDRFCNEIERMWKGGELREPEGEDVGEKIERARQQNWEVYIEKPVSGVEKLLDYLGRYVFRIAIGDYRILKVESGKVSFKYQDNRDGGKEKVMTLEVNEFIRRFLQHVLPKGFVRIRHYGLHHSTCRKKLEKARGLLGLTREIPKIEKKDLMTWLKEVKGEDVVWCPVCKKGIMLTVWKFGALTGWKIWFGMLLGRLTWRLVLGLGY